MSYEELMSQYKETLNKYKETMLENENLKLENNNLKRIIFGVKREYAPQQEQKESSMQCSLFDDSLEAADKKIQDEVKENVEEITVYRKKNSKKKMSIDIVWKIAKLF